LRKVVDTYRRDEVPTIVNWPGRVEIKSERSTFSMPRLDIGKRHFIEKKPLKPNKQQKGKVEVTEPAHTGRYEDATWGFSKHMPLPHHRKPGEPV